MNAIKTDDPRGPGLFPGLLCPDCDAPLEGGTGLDLGCTRCGRGVPLLAGGLPDFLGGSGARPAIADLPREALGALAGLVESGKGGRLPELGPLRACGLCNPDGSPGPVAWRLAYHLDESTRQEAGDWLGDFPDRTGLGPGARVLDVGCGAGQTLRLLDRREPDERWGLDVDAESLLLGVRLDRDAGRRLAYVRASAHRMPFADGRFTHLICRVALNYMHQPSALGQMARVLEPGGYLYCRVEGPGFDLRDLGRARGPRPVLGRLRGLALGAWLHASGHQPLRGAQPIGGRAFATPRGIGRVLRRSGCEVAHARVVSRHLGVPSGYEILARKSALSGRATPG